MPTNDKKRVRDQVDLIGNNHVHIKEYVRTRRPDVLQQVEALIDNDAYMFLMALAYSAGRCSVVAELEKVPIPQLVKEWGA